MTEVTIPGESDVTIPDEFLDPEGGAEDQDPDLVTETTTSRLRQLWASWMCRKGGPFADPTFFGKKIGGVPAPAVDAYKALEAALRSSGYEPRSSWAYNCRKIAGSNSLSLHSAGVAIDVDPRENPYSAGDPFSGLLKRKHVDAVLSIKNRAGVSIWSWGGGWTKPDRMHFQLDCGPNAVDVDWSTVPGEKEIEAVLNVGSKGEAVKRLQAALLVWNPKALPKFGADGGYGSETVEWVKKFQKAFGLDATGAIDGITAAMLVEHTKK